MSIKKISDTLWKLDVRIWIKSKAYRKRENFTGGKKAAETRVYQIKQELKAKADQETSSFKIRTFAEVLSFYSEHRELGRSKGIITRLSTELGHIELSDLPERFDFWLKEIRRCNSVATGNRYLSWSKSALNLTVRYGLIAENPLKRFEKLREIPRDRLLTEDERIRLFDVIRDKAPHIFPIVQYSMSVPCRKGELVAMRREWYDMLNNCIHIPAEFTKTKRPCIKPVPEGIREYMRNIPEESEFIFYRKECGRYVSIGDFKKAWLRCLRLAGIENFRFHDTRRSSYTDLILAGNHPHIVQKISGHATDMSRVYLNISNMQAIKTVQFKETVLDTVHSKNANE